MKKYLAAIALTIALPAMSHAQAVAAAPKAGACEKMKDMACCKDGKMDRCKDMAKMDHSAHGMKAGTDPHAGHDMSKMDHSAHGMKAGTDPHAGHDMSKMDHAAHGAKAVVDPHAGHDMSKPAAKSTSGTATHNHQN